jgi:transposase
MIGPAGNFRVYLACGVTDMRRGFDTLAAQVKMMLKLDLHDGALYAFRGRRGDVIKILWWDGQGLCALQQAPDPRQIHLAPGQRWFHFPYSGATLHAR